MRRFIAAGFTAVLTIVLCFALGGTPSYAATGDPTSRVIAGSDRYETAILLSKAGFPDGAPSVVIARGDDYPDALCGAPLAHAYGGPLLLTPPGGLTATLIAELQRLDPSRVFLLGLGSTVKNQVASILGPEKVTALAGKNRYETAAAAADLIFAQTGTPTKVVIAPGDSFPDALAVAPLAAVNNWPILYTQQYADLPQVTLDEIQELGVDSALVVGTWARVDLPDVVRKVGSDRYDTCAMIGRYALTQGLTSAHIGFVTGENFPDGIASGPYLALDRGMLLLSKGTVTTAPVASLLAQLATEVRLVEAIGLSKVPTNPWHPSGAAPTPTTPPTTLPPASSFDLKAAVAACPAGGTVNLPAGTITLASSVVLKSSITLKGQGMGVTVVKASADFPLDLTGTTGVTLEAFTLQGRGQRANGEQYGISVSYEGTASKITLRNLEAKEFSVAGFFGASSSVIDDLLVEGCVFHNCGEFGIAKGGTKTSSRWTIRNTKAYDFAGTLYPPHGIYLHNINGLLVEDCEAYGPLGDRPSGYSGFEFDDCRASSAAATRTTVRRPPPTASVSSRSAPATSCSRAAGASET